MRKVLMIAIAVATLLTGPMPASSADLPQEYQASYQQGRQEADAEIQSGRLTIYGIGMGAMLDKDPSTGLPIRSIAACSFDPATLGRAQGHNSRIREYLAR